MGKKKRKGPLEGTPHYAHEHTNATPTGLGQQISSAPGRLAKGPLQELCSSQPAAKWAPPAVPHSHSLCPSNPAAAVELELARAATIDQLRHKLASLCAKAGLRNVPLLVFERWRFAAKFAEDEPQLAAASMQLQQGGSEANSAAAGIIKSGSSSGSVGPARKGSSRASAGDTVLPFGTLPAAPEPGLVSDLLRAGLSEAAATSVALQLAQASAEAANSMAKHRHQLVSGKPPACPAVSVAFHKHSLDLTCGSRFVKISRTSYGKLARLYRQHSLNDAANAGTTAAPAPATCTVGLPLEEAAATLEAMEAAAAVAAGGLQAGSSPPAVAPHAAATAHTAGQEDDLSDADNEEGVAGSGSGAGAVSRQHVVLCAEAKIAELEQQQQQQQQQAAAGGAVQGDAAQATDAQHQAGDSSSNNNVRNALHLRLFALLLRYKSIQGHGFQAAAGPSVFGLLRQKMAVGCECFASPMNAHFNRYGSAFPDVDGPFGSAGSFFRMALKHGSYEANPPFVPAMLTATAAHILQLLQAAQAAGGALSFVVLMPGWEEVAGWKMLRGSTFLTNSLLVAAADHGYCDGASHQRRDLYRQSPYDSGILFLQTKAGAAKWKVTADLLRQMQTAMADCCPSAAAAERQRKQRGLADLEWRGLGTPVQHLAAVADEGVKGSGEGGVNSEDQQQQQLTHPDGMPVHRRRKKKAKKA